MISPNDVVLHMATFLPRVTNRFSVLVTVSSSTVTAADVVTVNAPSHGLSVGDSLAISSGRIHNPITAAQLDSSGEKVVFTTRDDHDYIYLFEPNFPSEIILSGFTFSGYNTTHRIQGVPNRRNVIIDLPTGETLAPVLNGNEVAEEDRNLGIRGFHNVSSIIDADNFTIQINGVPPLSIGPITGLEVIRNIRVAAVADIDRAREIYTKQDPGMEVWAFVIMGDVDVSKDPHTLNDTTAGFTIQDFQLLRFMQNFSVVVFIPTVRDLSGSEAQNLAYKPIFNELTQVLYGYGFNDPDSTIQYVTVNNGHGGNAPYNSSWYEHVYDWQLPFAIDYADGVDLRADVAFRNIESTWDLNRDEAAQLILNINLDEEPL